MDMLDIFALSGLEWVYDKVERRYGRPAAWFVTIMLTVGLVAAVIAILKRLL
jgi:hypothetical protein